MSTRMTFFGKSISIALPCVLASAAVAQDSLTSSSAALGPTPTSATASTAAASSGAVELLLTNIPGVPQAEINGLPGVFFDPGTGSTDFDRVYGSPNGNWILSAFADLDFSEDELLLVNGVLVQREGTPANWTTSGELAGLIDTRCDINDSGDYAFANNTNAVGPDEFIVTNIGGVFGVGAREEDPIPALPGATYGLLLESVNILGNGDLAFSADFVDGTTSSNDDDLLILQDTVIMQEGVTIPPGLSGAGTDTIQNFDISDYWVTEAGDHWLVQGDTDGNTGLDDVVIVDGAVVLQEGVVIPGSGFANPVDGSGIFGVHMDNGGNWFARGDNDLSDIDWVVRNGVVIAQTDGPIIDGGTETYSDDIVANPFFIHIGNTNGDYIIGGVTNNPDPLLDGVLVLNSSEVICRESDPIDLDGNGLFDDDVFINTFGNDDLSFADNGTAIIVATAKDGTGAALGQVVLRIDVGTGSIGSEICAGLPNSVGAGARLAVSGSASAAANDLTFDVTELPLNSMGYFVVSQETNVVMNPGGAQGDLCIASFMIGRYADNVLNSLTAGEVTFSPDLTLIPIASMGGTSTSVAMAGDTYNFQYWYRDVDGMGGATSNFSDAAGVTFE